jgi:NAD(P)-dependent dehydrogenase (short-subunit alcohol dehydrogenase family)
LSSTRLSSAVPDLTGKLAVITDASSGAGFGLTQRFAAAGADVVLAVHDLDNGQDAMHRIQNLVPRARQRVKRLDLSSLASIAALSSELAGEGRPVDFLINNAACPATPERVRTEDGFDPSFGMNHLGHYALTGQLLPLLRASVAARVVTVVSRDTPKLAPLMFALELDRRSRLGGWGIRSNAARSVAGDTAPVLFAAVSDAAEAGGYYGQRVFAGLTGATSRVKIPRRARDVKAARDLWRISEHLTGVTYLPSRRLPGTDQTLIEIFGSRKASL